MEERIRRLELEVLKLKTQTPTTQDSLNLYYDFIEVGPGLDRVYVQFTPEDTTQDYIVNAFDFEMERHYDQNIHGMTALYINGMPVWEVLPDNLSRRKMYVVCTQPGRLEIIRRVN